MSKTELDQQPAVWVDRMVEFLDTLEKYRVDQAEIQKKRQSKITKTSKNRR